MVEYGAISWGGERLDFSQPVTFNEKLQWLKINDRRPEYMTMVDKYKAKQYVAKIIGEQYIIPNLGVWDDFDEINFDKLPDQFVLKTTHDSGGVVVVKNKNQINIDEIKNKIEASLKSNYYYKWREWAYKNVSPRIIAEQFLYNSSEKDCIWDYKLLCFNGKVEYSFVCSNRFGKGGLFVNFYDKYWEPMPFIRKYPKNPNEVEKPLFYDKMVGLSELLTKNIPLCRVDFYVTDDRLYVGELTSYPGAGFEQFDPYEWDIRLGQMINI